MAYHFIFDPFVRKACDLDTPLLSLSRYGHRRGRPFGTSPSPILPKRPHGGLEGPGGTVLVGEADGSGRHALTTRTD